jgi:hypothetical protein
MTGYPISLADFQNSIVKNLPIVNTSSTSLASANLPGIVFTPLKINSCNIYKPAFLAIVLD